MEEFFYPRKRDWLLVMLGSLAILALGVWLVTTAVSPLLRCFGGILAGSLAILALAALLHLIPNNSFLKLTPDGMTVRSLWRTTEYRWVDIQGFGVAEFQTERGGVHQTHQRVGFNFSRYSPELKRITSQDRFNRRVGGFEAALPDTYGMNCSELAAKLNLRRNQYLGHRSEPAQPEPVG